MLFEQSGGERVRKGINFLVNFMVFFKSQNPLKSRSQIPHILHAFQSASLQMNALIHTHP